MERTYRESFGCRDDEPLQRELNALYDYDGDLSTKVLHRSRLNLFSRIVTGLRRRRLIRSFDSAIDVGCNAGVYSRMLSDLGFRRVLGIDVVEEMIRRATAAFGSDVPDHRVEFRLQSAESLDAEPPVDFVLCTEVIEHTEDPERVIANLRGLIRPGGLGVISLPNRISLPYGAAAFHYRRARGPRDPVFERHLEYPWFRTIRLFSGGGLRVIRTDGTNLFWDGKPLRALYPTPLFPAVNRVNFELARLWPLKYLAQFFYVVVRRDAASDRA